MKYVPPYGIADPDAPYINGDPSITRQGSIPPAEAFEHPMRELVAIIDNSMLVPTDSDLEQVAKGVRSQRMNYAEDTGSTNTLSVAFDPPLTGYSIGLPIRVKVKNNNTGPATIDAGAGRVPIKKPTGAQMASGDLPAGALAEIVYDGTSFQMINFGGAGGGTGDVFLVNIPYTVDSSGTPNTIIANFSPAITSLSAGTILMVKVSNTNTTFSNINVNGLGLKQVYAQGGSPNWPLLPSDMVAGDVLIFTYDGTRFWIYANTIINQNTSLNVSTKPDFDALFVALGRKRILKGINVTITIAIGVYQGPFTTEHPNADRIIVQGTMKTALPTFSDFNKTGSTPAARANDSANNIAMLRSRYGTEIQFNNIAGTSSGLSHVGGGRITFQNLLLTGANVDAGPTSPITAGSYPALGAEMACNGVSIWGSGCYGFVSNGGYCYHTNCFSTGCIGPGAAVTGQGMMTLQSCGMYGCGQGITADNQSELSLWSYGSIPGLVDAPPTQVMCNGSYGVISSKFGMVFANKANITANNFDIYAINGGNVALVSSTFGTTSPAPNTGGNNGAYITTE